MKLRKLGVCSWSLQPASPGDLAAKVQLCGLRWVQLALGPIREGRWDLNETTAALREANAGIASGMIEMRGEDYSSLDAIARTGGVLRDETWKDNLEAARECAAIAQTLGLPLVTFHAGVIPHDHNDKRRTTVIERIRAIVDLFETRGVAVALETGQEPARAMAEALAEIGRPGLGVNYDPANMILYGAGGPYESYETFRPSIKQFHMKDAVFARRAGEWGTEVPSGTGSVTWPRLLARIERECAGVNIMIEREGGGDRIGDVDFARRLAIYQLSDVDLR